MVVRNNSRTAMIDLIYLAVTVGFFLVSSLYADGCDQL